MADPVHVGDVGVALQVTIVNRSGGVVDVSSASTKELWLGQPNGGTLVKAASFVTSGSDGQIQYVTQAGDLSIDGSWFVQGHVVISSGEFHSDVGALEVRRNLK